MEKINFDSVRYETSLEAKDPDNLIAIIGGVKHNIPLDPANRHYQAIQEWVAEGNTIEEAD